MRWTPQSRRRPTGPPPRPTSSSEILHRAFEMLGERSDELALLMTLEMGKSLAESKGEITYAAEFFRWFSGEALRLDGYVKKAGNGQSRVMVMRQPIGPCFFITPWNFPTAMGTRKIGPAIAAGCTMVVKPAQQTPLSMLALAKLLEDCGLPPGVLNVVTATSSGKVSEPIIKDPRLRKLSFTGSTEVGRVLMGQAADQVLKTSMELGGNAPFLVFDDADLDAAVDGAMIAKMRNVGEACTSANRFHVHESVASEFAEQAGVERMGAMKIGHGAADGTEVGPLIDGDQRDKVAELVDDAVSKGATALTGGGARDGAGYFFEPTVLTDIADDARVLQEEIFGPVAPIATFSEEQEAIDAANAPSTAWSPTSSPATSTAPSGSARSSSPAWSASTRASSPTPARPSAASSSPASAARAATRASRSTSRPSTSR